ncbi:hypothetical protein EXIGLDRAFT_836842 [Exidia glandulosa HHB12029]|uniref:Beta-glucuronidase C-terminal domain-containing protein n=1 Tax=Exidia glandulosa HHB12029 TaxID=1314781 RepID=A0A166AHC3_EXIGL|nr:hypothetical protein EXIGLDRAFT_836842 [Exidia glandulosa HHB12029]
MNHAAIVRNVSLAQGAVKAAMAHNVSFANGEVGANIPGKDDLGLQHTLGSALWTIDYSLYSAFINIKHIHMQQAQGFAFAAWWPQNTKSNSNARSVRANFYGLKFVTEAMGTHTGPVRVASLDRVTGAAKTSDGRQQFVAYAIYESGKLARIALINMQIWLGEGTRPTSTATLKVGNGFKSTKYRVLTAAQGAREHNALKFGGVHWADSGLPSGTWSFKTQNVVNGTAKIQLGASEAALIDLIPA